MTRDDQHGAPDDQRGKVTEATRRADEQAVQSSHRADRPASPEEQSVLEDEPVDQDVREHYEEMAERGVAEKGEGRIP
jgi:hypothetical protein